LVVSDEYICVEARDPLHTLRSLARVTFGAGEYSASFVGDPELGGNWLIAGNLNGDHVIDVLDNGIVLGAIADGVSYPNGDTTCETEAPHADTNGDGAVDVIDKAICDTNFLATDKLGCQQRVCSDPNAVGRASTMQVDIQLSPNIVDGPITRCVCFTLFDCCTESTEVCQEVTFTVGLATDVPVPLPPGSYPSRCVEARDPLHTLASVSDVNFDGMQHWASFVGDPELGGNWLIAGNLNGDHVIDILDNGIVLGAIADGVSYPNGDTTCETEAPHADINGDGVVDGIEKEIIHANFLATDKLGCAGLVCADLGDTDGDGIINCCDPCPRDNPDDTDGDGICESDDLCPGVDDTVFAPECEGAIPTTSQWGLIVLTLLLLVGIKMICFGRRV